MSLPLFGVVALGAAFSLHGAAFIFAAALFANTISPLHSLCRQLVFGDTPVIRFDFGADWLHLAPMIPHYFADPAWGWGII